jgi:hypothetical protein
MFVVKYELYNSVRNEYFETMNKANKFIHDVETLGGRTKMFIIDI